MVKSTEIEEVKIIDPKVFKDERGFFYESFNINSLQNEGINFIPVQQNCAFSIKKGTIRGLHFQNNPMAQAKLVRCTVGRVMDYAVDLRKDSPTYLKHVKVELSAENKRQLYIPRGFAHGVISLEDNSTIEYFADNPYSPENDRSIRYDDPSINIKWEIEELILSEKDKNAPFAENSDCNFVMNKGEGR